MSLKGAFILDYEIMSPISMGSMNLIKSILENKSADDIITNVDVSGIPFKRGAEVKEELSHLWKEESAGIRELIRRDRKLELLAACWGYSKDRFETIIDNIEPHRTGIIIGVGADAMSFEHYENEMVEFLVNGYNPVNELCEKLNRNHTKLNFINNPYDIYSIYLAQKFNATAYQKTVLTACVSSTQAIALAYDSILNGTADVVVAGGTDSLINLLAMICFGKLGVISESNDICCKPFDINRNGTLAGECAGFVILSNESFAKKCGIKPKGKVIGYGNTLDAYKITAPDPKGDAMTKAIEIAMNKAKLAPFEIDYINAHGTGTQNNDQLELKCYQRALGSNFEKTPISSTKDRHGHAIAAAGIQEFCILMSAMEHGIIPANLHLVNPCENGFNLVRKNAKTEIKMALTSNFAFGGINTVLAVQNLMI